jgi:hypothetical protein
VQRQPLPSAPAGAPAAGPDIAAVAAEIDAELAEIEPLVAGLTAGVTTHPADYALNEVRGTAIRLGGDLEVASQFASRADAPPSIARAAARFQTLRTSFAAVAAVAQHWYDANPAGESLEMWNERLGTWLAGAGAREWEKGVREWEKGGWHTLSSAAAYTGAGAVAVVEGAERLLSFGFHDAATAVSQAYTRGDISWNEGIRIAWSAAWRAILTAAVTRGAGAATGRLGVLAARGVRLAPTGIGYGLAAGGVSAGLTGATSLATQSLLTSAHQQHFASPAARAIWMQAMPSGKDWAWAVPISVIVGGLAGARAVELSRGATWPQLSGMLRDAAKGKGMFGVGSATQEQATAVGRAWVGEGATLRSDGKTLLSSDELRQFRPPSYKPDLGKWQANLEARLEPSGEWQGNAHIDILDPP